MHLVTGCCFLPSKKDGGHTIQSVVGENPMLHSHFTAVCIIDNELLAMEFLHCKEAHSRMHPLHEYLLWPFSVR